MAGTCRICGSEPCDWEQFGDEILEEVRERCAGPAAVNREKRKAAYGAFVRLKHGVLGRGRRVQISHCVLAKIREEFPDPAGSYMGYRSS